MKKTVRRAEKASVYTLGKWRHFCLGIVGLMLTLHTLPAAALACNAPTGILMNPSRVLIIPSRFKALAIGETIVHVLGGGVHTINCQPAAGEQYVWLLNPTSGVEEPGIKALDAPNATVFKSNISGIGYVIRAKTDNDSAYTQLDSKYPYVFIGRTKGRGATPIDAEYLLVKTGPVLASTNNGLIIVSTQDGSRVQTAAARSYMGVPTSNPSSIINSGTSIYVNNSTCQLLNKDQVVSLAAVHTAAFTGEGSQVVPGNGDFNIDLNCDAGINLYITLTDARNAANTGADLTIDSGHPSDASGFTIQLLRDNGSQLIAFGPDSAAIRNPNSWHVGSSLTGQGVIHIPIETRYVQRGSTVRPGDVRAMATFTLSYQ